MEKLTTIFQGRQTIKTDEMNRIKILAVFLTATAMFAWPWIKRKD